MMKPVNVYVCLVADHACNNKFTGFSLRCSSRGCAACSISPQYT